MGRWPSQPPQSVYFIGIGGSAMSNLAAILVSRGIEVRGSDRAVYPPASGILANAGIEPSTPYAASNLDPRPDLVVVGNAISRGNAELEAVLDLGLPLASMSELIERLMIPGKRVSVVAGTHGKTTTSSLLAHLHQAAGTDPSFFVGGEIGNTGLGARWTESQDLIIEGDEYDTAFFDKGPKFLHYWPQIAVLGTVEFDHADIFEDLAAVKKAFSLFVRMVPRVGTLIADADCAVTMELAEKTPSQLVTFGLNPRDGDHWTAASIQQVADGLQFDVVRAGQVLTNARLPMHGDYNIKNALAALAAANAAQLDVPRIVGSLAEFQPPKRRLQSVARNASVEVYDDFAHHPTAVQLTVEALKERVVDGGRLVVCLEPRSNTMVRRLVQERLFEALSLADRVLVAPVDRPERFSDDERLDVHGLISSLVQRGVDAEGPLDPDAIFERVVEGARPGDIVVLMSNGAFGGLSRRLADAIGSQAASQTGGMN